jgi:serine protease Do
MAIKTLSSVLIIFLALSIAGCNTGLLSGDDVPTLPNQSAPPPPLVVDGMRTSYADVVERTSAAVVRIEAEARNRPRAQAEDTPQSPFDFFRQFPDPGGSQRPPLERGMGSGVIVNGDGTILTNAHVIDGAEKITVLTNDNKTFEAKLVGADKPSDLAVLKIEGENLPAIELGNSDEVRVGDIVLAIGNPLGIGQTVTAGIISAKGRRTGLSDGSFEDFLQTDAPINRGNSGGALVNLNAELIGINSQILSTSGGNIGIGFSIPSNMAKSVMNQLLSEGRVRRGRLGIQIQNIVGDMARALELEDSAGVLVNNVDPGSAADKAGVKRRDVITAVNGDRIHDGNVLRNKIAGTLPGTEVKLTIIRDGATQELAATLDEFDAGDQSAKGPAGQDRPGDAPAGSKGRLGVTVQPLSSQAAKELALPADGGGVVVTDVEADGVAADAGIQRGDVILEIDRQVVRTADEVQAVLEKTRDRPIILLVSRRGSTFFLTVRLR